MLTKGNLIKLFTFIVCLAMTQASIGKDLYMSPTGSDTNNGSASSPVFTITKAQALAEPGDVVHIKAGHYKYDNSQITDSISPYAIAFHMKKSGTADKHIIYKRGCHRGVSAGFITKSLAHYFPVFDDRRRTQ